MTTAEREPDTRERLIDAARALFAEKGFDGASTREIATRAGCNLAMINHYFGSKEGLLRAVLEAGLQTMGERLRDLQRLQAPPEEKLALFIDFAVEHFNSNCLAVQIVHREIMQAAESKLRDEFLPLIAGNVLALKSILDEAAAAKRLADIDTKLAAGMLFGMIHSYFTAYPMTSRLIGPSTPELLADLKRHAKQIFVHGVMS